ncbi:MULTISPECIES: DUF302 domain-containing protein [unclassified Ruegeria]|uniref:DUF302 domain-containing protein n=1 Tax=unclassified Ruegeria TaxID=2625375 RepID=UPI001489E5BA|nr:MULTISPECIES: DUF302 domain-containing protein [unclassified Ruegeria]
MTVVRTKHRSLAGISLIFATAMMAQASSVQEAVDENITLIEVAIEEAGLASIASIDHARLAAAEGVEMPPSRVQIFSDPEINTPILKENIRAGLDLPFRVLSYAQDGTAEVIHTGSDFLEVRHGLRDKSALDTFSQRLGEVTREVDGDAATTDGLSRDYGVIELTSALSVAEAVENLTKIVMAQDDTVWFGEIDFTAEAATQGTELPKAVLLLFGGPGPGGIAMEDFPAIGLDAFCQKLLVYAGDDGGSVVIFNDIAAFAELYYGSSAKPHHALNERLTATFQKALQ